MRFISLRILLSSGLLIGSPLSLCAEESPLSKHELAVQELFEVREETALQKAILNARENGITKQTILEARFLYIVDRNEIDELTKLIPDLEAQAENFNLSESQICSVKEEWLAIVEYAKALKALEAEDELLFKKHISEAFWLCPERAPAYAPYIEKLRLDNAMEKVKLNLNVPLTHTITQKAEPLCATADKSKALVIHFWSPWSRECQAFMGDFAKTSQILKQNGLEVVSILSDKSPSATKEASSLITQLKDKPQCSWLTDNNKAQLTGLLRIKNLPTIVLVDTEGKVLFNGHPTDEELWQKLQKIDSDINRPQQVIE